MLLENQNNPAIVSIKLRNQHHAQFDGTQGSTGRGSGGGAVLLLHAAAASMIETAARTTFTITLSPTQTSTSTTTGTWSLKPDPHQVSNVPMLNSRTLPIHNDGTKI